MEFYRSGKSLFFFLQPSAHVLPVLTEQGAIHLFVRTTLRELIGIPTVHIDLPPHAKNVPIGVPNVQEETIFCAALIRGENGVLVGRKPLAWEGDSVSTWVWIQAELGS